MVTIFTIPKAFKNHFATIQENAIASWCQLRPKPQIILLGNEEGISPIAKKYHALHIQNVKKNKLGTPILSDGFNKAYKFAKYPKLAFVNTDIILLDDFMQALNSVKIKPFFIIGKRWNLEINKKINFGTNWQKKIQKEVSKKGKLGRKGANDYFVFTPKINFKMPGFVVGRTSWDNWLIYKAKFLGIPVIDATSSILAIHQNHDYSHAGGFRAVWEGPESTENKMLVKNKRMLFNVKDADYILTNNRLEKRKWTPEKIINYLQTLPVIKPKYTIPILPLLFIFKTSAYLRDKLLR